MNIIKIILLATITITDSFMNTYSILKLSNNMRPLLYKPSFNKPLTSLKCSYLENIENASYYEKNNTVLLPKPIPIYAQNKIPKPMPKPIPKPIPIPRLTFDNLFLILFSIQKIYISSNSDRIIVEYDNKKGVFYINNFVERNKIEFLLSLINVDVTIVNDYPTKMDYPNGELYCSPNFTMNINITEAEIEDIINGIIHKYESENESSDDYYDVDDDIDRMI
uniref:Uncharacterized protein n=1 Tax=viral metagenome TaxID=1070528 RepID=A0A6C0J0A0_9ZZZZ